MHTKGPWQYHPAPLILAFEVFDSSGPHRDGSMYVAGIGHTRTPGEAEANARLIAAAPDLLDACKRALHLVEENNEEIVQMSGSFGLLSDLQAAIAKATSPTDER